MTKDKTMLCGDLECNSLDPNEIYLVGVLDYFTDEYVGYSGDDVPLGLARLEQADLVLGHNFRNYDAKVIRTLTEGLVTIGNDKILDTLDLSRKLFPEMRSHKLEDWGALLDFPKIHFKDFSKYTPEMNTYCERDCRIVKRMIEFFCTVDPNMQALFSR